MHTVKIHYYMPITTSTVLAVDDEPASLRALRRAVTDECMVLTAGGGAEALALLAAQPVALMIADQRMPDMLGTELLAVCAARFPDVLRVLLTGYTDVDTLVEAINAGHVYAYLAKPWEPGELRLVVRRGLEHFAAESERRRLVRELERSRDQARREAAQKTRLLALAAHELGTPVHLLDNALDLLATAGVPEAAAPWLETARRSALWLARGLAQMHRGARALPSRLQLHRSAVAVGALVHATTGVFAAPLARRRLAVETLVTPELPPVWADPRWLQRALENLLSNAIRFTPDGGSVCLEATGSSSGVEISIRDTGIGIDHGMLEDIFEPFSSAGGDLLLHASGSLEFGSRGLGLGLSIARAVVEQHGGTITVQSEPGVGSTFSCRFGPSMLAAAAV
jgi:two-component system sensor histidine kinase/response regulator